MKRCFRQRHRQPIVYPELHRVVKGPAGHDGPCAGLAGHAARSHCAKLDLRNGATPIDSCNHRCPDSAGEWFSPLWWPVDLGGAVDVLSRWERR